MGFSFPGARLPQRLRLWPAFGEGAIAAHSSWDEQRVHLLGGLPWLVLLNCPLLDKFTHGGHRRRAVRGGSRDECKEALNER